MKVNFIRNSATKNLYNIQYISSFRYNGSSEYNLFGNISMKNKHDFSFRYVSNAKNNSNDCINNSTNYKNINNTNGTVQFDNNNLLFKSLNKKHFSISDKKKNIQKEDSLLSKYLDDIKYVKKDVVKDDNKEIKINKENIITVLSSEDKDKIVNKVRNVYYNNI